MNHSGGGISREQARRVLGVGAKASPDEIRSAYRAALKRAHPDLGGSDDKLRLVLDAFQALDVEIKPAPGARPSQETHHSEAALDRLEITPVIAMAGGRVTTRLADGRRITVSLQRGLRHGDRIKLRDTLMTVSIKGRRELFVSGDDLCMMIKTSAAVLQDGGRISVKTPMGVRNIWAPRQEGTNHIVRIPGQGLPATRKHAQGALILKLVPETGPKESRLRARLKKFAGDWAAA